jgi:hypothetical protein
MHTKTHSISMARFSCDSATVYTSPTEYFPRQLLAISPSPSPDSSSTKELRALLPVDGDGYVLNGRLSDLTAGYDTYLSR